MNYFNYPGGALVSFCEIFRVIFLLSVVVINTFAQQDQERIVATIGGYEISEDEFLERYELTPRINAAYKEIENSLKNEVLYSIIAEKLWALEAEELRLTKSELLESSYKTIEKMYVRDALYREEILTKVKLTDDYLLEAFSRSSKILKVNYIFGTNEREIRELDSKIKAGASFDSLLMRRSEYTLQKEPYSVQYGQMEKDVEDILYSMKTGDVSAPVQAPNGWYIFKLISSEEKIIKNAEQADAERKNVIRIASATVTDSIYSKFYEDFFSDKNAETNTALFLEFAELVATALNERYKNEKTASNEELFLLARDLYKIESALGERKLNEEFIKMDDHPATLNEVLQFLAFEKFSVDTLDNNMIKAKLNSFIKRFIEHELLAGEGYRRGLENLPEVQRYLKMWRDYYLSESLKKELAESITVSDEEALSLYKEKTNTSIPPTYVKILEILTEDLSIIRDALEEFKEGTDFRDLALRYTIREEALNNNGELGYFSENEFGEIGRIASTLEVGEIYGPVKVPDGYSLFKLIDKKHESNSAPVSFSESKDRIKTELKYRKYSEELINKTVDLANKYGITVNQEILKGIDVLNTTTVVYRHFGFGGRLLAVPMTATNYLWVEKWREQEELSP
jgi:foldase protein PrsA